MAEITKIVDGEASESDSGESVEETVEQTVATTPPADTEPFVVPGEASESEEDQLMESVLFPVHLVPSMLHMDENIVQPEWKNLISSLQNQLTSSNEKVRQTILTLLEGRANATGEKLARSDELLLDVQRKLHQANTKLVCVMIYVKSLVENMAKTSMRESLLDLKVEEPQEQE